jgi:hypothetical protein
MLTYYATRLKVVGSIPSKVTEFLNWRNPAGRTVGRGVDSASKRN